LAEEVEKLRVLNQQSTVRKQPEAGESEVVGVVVETETAVQESQKSFRSTVEEMIESFENDRERKNTLRIRIRMIFQDFVFILIFFLLTFNRKRFLFLLREWVPNMILISNRPGAVKRTVCSKKRFPPLTN
jgi:hypothetical protein